MSETEDEVVDFSVDVSDLDVETLREEHAELNERKFSRTLSADGQERLGDVWAELRQRVDVDQPECPECGARNWVFTDHTECAECSFGPRMDDEELLEEIQLAWDRIAGREEVRE